MSHFTVLVAAKDNQDLDRVLLPYHEYECTGLEAYTERLPIDLDDAEADYKKYAKADESGVKPAFEDWLEDWLDLSEEDKDRDGVYRTTSNHRLYAWYNSVGRLLYHAYDDQELPGTSFPVETINYGNGETREFPIETTLNVDDPALLADFLNGLTTGVPVRDELTTALTRKRSFVFPAGVFRLEDFTGPLVRGFVKGRKWDWWSIGGRWTGSLHLKPGAKGETNKDISRLVEPNTNPKRADIALAGDVDWDSMRQEQIDHIAGQWDRWKALPPKEDEEARKKAINESSELVFFDRRRADEIDEGISRDDYIAKYGKAYALTFAYIDREGRWVERGNMGWFAVVSEENDDYNNQWWEFVRSLPDDQNLFVIDCHI